MRMVVVAGLMAFGLLVGCGGVEGEEILPRDSDPSSSPGQTRDASLIDHCTLALWNCLEIAQLDEAMQERCYQAYDGCVGPHW